MIKSSNLTERGYRELPSGVKEASACRQMDFRGLLRFKVEADGNHARYQCGAYDGTRSERAFDENVNLGGIAEVSWLLSHWG